jgi:hypothetical protein
LHEFSLLQKPQSQHSSADPNNTPYAGESYVVFGRTQVTASIDLSNLDSANGFAINGISAGDLSGSSVSSAGDVFPLTVSPGNCANFNTIGSTNITNHIFSLRFYKLI